MSHTFLALEPRVVFDAAVAATTEQAVDQLAQQQADAALTGFDPGGSADMLPDGGDAIALAEPTGTASHEIAFVDSSIADIGSLLARLDPSIEVVILDPTQDGVEQIAAALDGRTGIDAIHVLSHGSEGQLTLGNAVLNAASMQSEHLDELTAIGKALSADGDILIYGCDFTGGEAGLEAAMILGGITGADIAASTDATGHADLGGDWELETDIGLVESAAISAPDWHDLLGTSTATLDWATQPSLVQGSTVNYTIGGLTNAVSISVSGTGYIDGNATWNTGGTGDPTMTIRASTTSTTVGQTVDITFNSSAFPNGVTTAAFDLRNIDAGTWDDRVIVQAYDINGVLLAGTNITATPRQVSGQTYSITNLANGKQFDGNIDGASDDSPIDSVGLSISSTTGAALGRVTILYVSGTSSTPTGALGLSDITVTYDSPPTLDLDLSGSGTGYTTTFTEGGAGVAIADTDVTITDDDANEASATVVLTNKQTSDFFSIGGTAVANGSTGTINGLSYSVVDNGSQITITLTGSASKAVYQSTLQAITFANSSDYPSTVARTVNVTVSDGVNTSNTAVATIDVLPQPETLVDLNSTWTSTSSSTAVTTNLVQNGTFADNSATPANWSESGTIGTGASGRYVWIGPTDSITQSLTIPVGSTTSSESVSGSVLTTVETVVASSGITAISFDMAWQNADTTGANDDYLVVSYGGVDYARFKTGTNNGNNNGTWTYIGPVGGSVSVGSIAAVANEVTGTLTAVTINLPSAITTSGNLVFHYTNGPSGAGSDDLAIDNIVVNNTVTTTVTTYTTDLTDVDWNTTYTQGGSAVSIADTDSSVFDVDSANMASATVVLTNAQVGDRLLIGGTPVANGSTGTINGLSYTVTEAAGQITVALSGSATKAVYADTIEAISFENTSGNAQPAIVRDITVTVSDGANTSNTAHAYITVVNTPPTLDLDGFPAVSIAVSGGGLFSQPSVDAGVDRTNTLTFDLASDMLPESTFAVAQMTTVDDTIRISVNGVSISSGNIAVDSGGIGPQLRFADNSTVVTGWVANSNGLPRLEVRLTEAGIEFWGTKTTTSTALEQLTYAGTLTLPDFVLGTNTIVITNVNGSGPESINGVLTVTAQSTSYATTYTENGSPVAITDFDSFITDASDTHMESASVTLTNPQSGDRLLVGGSSASSGTIGSISWTRTDTTVTFSGSDTKANYAAALEQVQFENTGDMSTVAHAVNRTIAVVVNDGDSDSNTAIATISINLAPDPSDDSFSGNENQSISGNVLSNDTDVGTTPTPASPLTLVSGPSNGSLTSFDLSTGAFSYMPNANFTGTDTFTYRFTDANGDSNTATVTITVMAVNSPPVADDAAITVDEESADTPLGLTAPTDNDGDPLTITVTGLPSIGTVTLADGTPVTNGMVLTSAQLTGLQFDAPAELASTTVTSFTYTVDDGTAPPVTGTATITVNPINDVPVAQNDDESVNEDSTLFGQNLLLDNGHGADSDNDGDPLTVTRVNGALFTSGDTIALPSGALLTIGADGSYTYDPNGAFDALAAGDLGSDGFDYQISDGHGGFDTATVTIQIVGANDAPIAGNDTVATPEDTPVTIDVLNNDSDVDGDPLHVTEIDGSPIAIGGPGVPVTGGVVTLDPTGNPIFTPNPNYFGLATFTYTVADPSGATGIATVSIDVTPVDDDPVAFNNAYTATEDAGRAVVGNALTDAGPAGTDNDPDGDTLTVVPRSNVAGSSGGLFSISATGTVTFNPNGDFESLGRGETRVTSITYTISDGHGGTDTATISVTVIGQNDRPTAPDVSYTTGQDKPVSGRIDAADADGDRLSFSGPRSGPEHGLVVVNKDGTFRYVPQPGFSGTDRFVVAIDDGHGGHTFVTVDIEVLADLIRQFEVTDTRLPPLASLTNGTSPTVVDGIVLDTINTFGPLGDVGLEFSGSGIILDTVNGIDQLERHVAVGHDADAGPIESTAEIERLSTRAAAAFPLSRGFWDVQSLTGFSIRMGIDVSAGLSSTDKIVVDTLMRDRVIFIEISDTIPPEAEVQVRSLAVRLADGRPLPRWVDVADNGLLLVDAPLDRTTLDLRITALMSDGSSVTRSVTIQLASGEVQELRLEQQSIPLFEEQLRRQGAN
ncbi:MAG: Ig-like domain-containing protein [Hyphomicrobiaceae bacterium]